MQLFEKDKVLRKNILILNLCILISFISFFAVKLKLGVFGSGFFHLRGFTFFEFWMLLFNWFLFGNSLWNVNPYASNLSFLLERPVMLFLQVLLLFIFVHGLTVTLRGSKNENRIHPILYFLALPLFLLLLNILGFKKSYIERGAFMVIPFFYMILAKGAVGFKIKSVRLASISIVLILSVASFVGYVNNPDVWTVYKPNPDWRKAASYLDTEIKNSGKPLIVYAATPASVLIYYNLWFKDAVEIGPGLPFRQRNRFEARPTPRLYLYYYGSKGPNYIHRIQLRKNVRTFYVIKNIHWAGNSNNMFKGLEADSRFHLQDVQYFKGLEIYKFKVV